MTARSTRRSPSKSARTPSRVMPSDCMILGTPGVSNTPSQSGATHVPALQLLPAGHACPHDPQFVASASRSTHWPLHETWFTLHGRLHVHPPPSAHSRV